MFSLVDEGIIQIPKSAWLTVTNLNWQLLTSYIYVYTWYMDLHNQLDKVHNIQLYSAIILWSSYKLTIMINDTVAQSSTDSSAIQIPKYFFKILFF